MAEPPAGNAHPSTPPEPTLTDGRTLGRYLLLERLGAGGMGVVFKARDTERGDVVALKTLQRLSASSLLSFKNEFRSVANISHHHLVTLYELACDGDTWFFTMEYIAGQSLANLIASQPTSAGVTRSTLLPLQPSPASSEPRTRTTLRGAGGLDLSPVGQGVTGTPPAAAGQPTMAVPLIRRVFRELAVAVDVLHASRKLHRDIKPANVMIADDGRVVLLDFGLVAESAPHGLQLQPSAVGTPAYMAPELVAGEPATEASDWYAVGVMLFEALTGQLPFPGSSAQMLVSKMVGTPPALEPSATVPADLCDLALELLDRDPARRPKGPEILARFWAEEGSGSQDRAPGGLRLIGREEHVSSLWAAFNDVATSGRLGAVAIRGGSGMGKSALIEDFLAELRRRPDVLVLAGRCYEQETVPYKALDAVVDNLARYLAQRRKETTALISRDSVEDLARAFPVLAVGDEQPRADDGLLDQTFGHQQLRKRTFRALKTLLHKLSIERVLVVAIDDLQWGDADSAVVLEELISPPDAPRMLLIHGYRSPEGESSPVVSELLRAERALGSAIDLRDLVIEALLPDQAARLAAHWLDCAPDDPLATAIARESGGNPFFLERLARHTRGQPLVEASGIPRAARVDDLVLSQLLALPENARRLLETIVVAGRPVAQPVAARAAGVSGTDRNAWATLRSLNLVRVHGEGDREEVETYHDRIREAIGRQLAPSIAAAAHQRLGESFEAVAEVDPEIPASHFLAAGSREKAGHYSVLAAGRAARKLAFARAAEFYRQAMECLPGDPTLAIKRADSLVNAGRCAESAPLYLAAAAADEDVDRAFHLRTRAAEQLLTSGRIEDGLEILKPLLTDVGIPFPKTPLRALFGIIGRSTTLRMRGDFIKRPVDEPSAIQRKRIDVTWAAGKGLGSVDIMRGGYFIYRSTDLAAQARDPRSVARGLAQVGLMTVSRAKPREIKQGMTLIEQAAGLGASLGDPYLAGFAKINLGTARMTLGEWALAKGELAEGLAMLEGKCTGVSWECSFARACMVNVLRYLGDLDELTVRGGEWLRTANENGDRYGGVWIRIHTAATLLAAGDAQAAQSRLTESVAGWSWSLFTPQHMVATLLGTECDLYRGDPQAAFRRLDQSWKIANRSFVLGWQITRIWALQLRAGTALALARVNGDLRETLLARARRCSAQLEKEGPRPYVRGAASVVKGGLAGVLGQTAEAATQLGLAAGHFDAAGMALHAASARWVEATLREQPERIAESERTFQRYGVRDVRRWAQMYVPGVMA